MAGMIMASRNGAHALKILYFAVSSYHFFIPPVVLRFLCMMHLSYIDGSLTGLDVFER